MDESTIDGLQAGIAKLSAEPKGGYCECPMAWRMDEDGQYLPASGCLAGMAGPEPEPEREPGTYRYIPGGVYDFEAARAVFESGCCRENACGMLAAHYFMLYRATGTAIDMRGAVRLAELFRRPPSDRESCICRLADACILADDDNPIPAPDEDTISEYVPRAASCPDHWDALRQAAEWLRQHRQPLGDALTDWLARCTPRPDGRTVARAPTYARRNHSIIEAVRALEGCGMKATRNEVSPPGSACDAVAGAHALSYETVRKIWNTCPRP